MSPSKTLSLSPELRESLSPENVDDLLVSVKYYVDEDFAHIKIKDQSVCADCKEKPCLSFCPAGVFSIDQQGIILVGYQACVECGSCRVGCPDFNVDWELPYGGYGVAYKFG
ncbi:MAG: 4Fe-4S dicluster domain-containing protein [Chloroflexi bacterium]|nr:4Fe-4S dicluster domain-containing protein [Chloroflexota bacterium]